MAISNLTLHEIKEFFKGSLIDTLQDERYYVKKIEGNLYSVKNVNMNKFLGTINSK